MNEITNADCPHLTGVTHNSYEECEMGKACTFSIPKTFNKVICKMCYKRYLKWKR